MYDSVVSILHTLTDFLLIERRPVTTVVVDPSRISLLNMMGIYSTGDQWIARGSPSLTLLLDAITISNYVNPCLF